MFGNTYQFLLTANNQVNFSPVQVTIAEVTFHSKPEQPVLPDAIPQ